MALRQGALLVFVGLLMTLGLVGLLGAPFHEDEAIYAAWSLAILRGDPWLWQTPVDKAPLTFYPIALSLALFGRHEWAARLPALLWTLLLLGLVWRIAEQRGAPGWLAVLFALLSPLLWALAGSAFTDPAMVALSLLAVERAMIGQPGQAGLAFALALLAKPTALFLLPLALFPLRAQEPRAWQRFFLAGAAPLLLAWAWDASREASSWWVLGRQAYGTLGQGASQWRGWAGVLAPSLGWQLLIGGLAAYSARTTFNGSASQKRVFEPWLLLLSAMLLGWIPLHALLGLQPWERYLLPLVPLSALLWAELFPLQALGVPPGWLPSMTRAPLRQALRFQRPWSPSPLPLAALNRRARVSYPPRRLYGMTGLTGALLLLMPAFVTRYQLEPHDGRWTGMAEIGAAVEALPREATLYYLDAGRPLAWYAADARAKLVWVGATGATLPAALRQDRGRPHYLVLTRTSLDARPAGWEIVNETENVVLLTDHALEESPN